MKTDPLPPGLRKELMLAQARQGLLTFSLYDRTGSRTLTLTPGRRWLIGRDRGSDLPVDERGVSTLHALLSVDEEGPSIEDLGSKNGTWVNGKAITRRLALSPGDRVGIGAAHGSVASLTPRDRQLIGHDAFMERLEQEIHRARAHHRPLCVAMIQAETSPRAHISTWAARVIRCLHPYQEAAIYASSCIELLLPETAGDEAEALVTTFREAGKPAALRGAAGVYPRDGVDAATLLHHLREKLARHTPETSATPPPRFLSAARWLAASQRETMRRLARARCPLLVVGETGTGKERWARELHRLGAALEAPFVPIACAAIPETLIESTLFGHRAGAFTGATRDQLGLLRSARGGTLFFDEIAALSPRAQGVLLEVLESGRFRPVGESDPQTSEARVIAATSQDLDALVSSGSFRADLRFRLGGDPITLLPLRGRRQLIAELAEHFARLSAHDNELPPLDIPSDVMDCLRDYLWPGNMRELRNVIERATILAEDGILCVDDLPRQLQQLPSRPADVAQDPAFAASFRERVDRFERLLILDAIRASGGNQSDAARTLGIPRRTLVHKLQSLGIRELLGQGKAR